ncbi:MAG: hypothetical protein AAF456_01400 [Planctomycetota bacterium]
MTRMLLLVGVVLLAAGCAEKDDQPLGQPADPVTIENELDSNSD